MSFIDAHHGELGIEPICRELAVAPSSWHQHAARLADPSRRSVRARRDDEIMERYCQTNQNLVRFRSDRCNLKEKPLHFSGT